PPVEPLREGDAGDERGAEHEQRTDASGRLGALFPWRKLRRPRRDGIDSLAARPRGDGARPQLAQKEAVLGELPLELRLQLGRRHRFAGGSSPVAIRQIPEAARRAAIVAPAPSPAYSPVQSS